MKKITFLLFYIFLTVALYSFKILWWNIENLFDEIDEPDKDDLVIPKPIYLNKIDKIASFLKKVNSEIVGLAEVENIRLLEILAKKADYPFFYLVEGNDPRGIDVALLSKIKLVYYKSNKDKKTPYKGNYNYKFSRDCPVAFLYINKKPLYILLTHLKAAFENDSKSLIKRIAQVKGILDIIDSIYKESNNEPYVLLMGDLNSTRYSEPMNILEKSGLIILNYFFDANRLFTIKIKNQKYDIDYFVVNKLFYEKIRIKKLKAFHLRELEEISDHFPLLFEFDFK